jgi:murein DD-endopeptidase MepM/ murein hydrolase activator NlpD
MSKKVLFYCFVCVSCVILFSACQTRKESEKNTSPSETSTLGFADTSMVSTSTPLLSTWHTLEPTNQSTPDVMRFSLPTPGGQPVTAWRAPLYPIPWAVSPFDHFYFTRPISVDQMDWPNPDYRYGGIFFKPSAVHTGIDIPADKGTPVLAAGPGEVIWAGWGLYTGDPTNTADPYGLAVVILHDFGYQDQPLYTVYAHLERVDVNLGEWLKTGDSLGIVGQTGFTTGSHLHFEVRIGENSYYNTSNPELWLVPPQGLGVIVMRITDSYNNPLPDLEVSLVHDDTGTEWILRTYPALGASSDLYYQENLVLSDLPAGSYTISFIYFKKQEIKFQIRAGQISYLSYRGLLYGFGSTPPPTSRTDFYLTPIP